MPVVLCKIEGCDNAKAVRGWCHKHYGRWQRHGDPLTLVLEPGTPEERLWRNVDKRGPDECWEWTAARRHGYGIVQNAKGRGKGVMAHRLSYEIANGPIPDGLVVMHICDNPPCVNPAHLRQGTQRENTLDMMSKGRGNWRAPRGEDSPRAIITEAQAREILFSDEKGTVLAARFGIKPTTVCAIRRGRLWAHLQDDWVRGPKRTTSKLTADDVRLIRASDKTATELGELLGVTSANIRMIRRRVSWSHIP